MQFINYLNIGLTYIVIGFAAAIIICFLLKKNVPGNFWGALLIGLIGSFLGGTIYRLIPDIINRLADINYVNVYAAFSMAIALILLLSKISSHK